MLLVQLGASEKLEFTDRGTLKRNEALALPNGPTQKPAVVKQYVEFLLTSRNEGGAEHCAEACRVPRYLHQHSVYQLISSKWLDSFLELPIFWTVLKQNWSFVETHPTMYHCAWGDVAAYGSLRFYAEQHCLRVAEKPLRQLHAPSLLQPIAKFLPENFKQVPGAQELSSQQQTQLGFRDSFSYEEIVSILRELPKYSVTAAMKKVIVILYNALLQLPSSQHPKEIGDDLQLLGADDQFHLAKELFLIPGIFVPSSVAHPNILFHEMKMTAQQRSLGALLGVRVLNANDFKLKHEDRATPSELMKLFERRAAYVVWSEYEFDNSPQGQLPLREYVATAHAALLAQLKTRVIKIIPTITLLFEEIFSLIETVFLTSKVLYHTPFTSNLSAQTRLAQKIRAVFNLKMPATELWDLLLGNKDVLDGSKPLTDDDKQFLENFSTRRKNKRNDDDDNDSDRSEGSASSSTKRARSAAASPARADDDVYERSTSQSTFAENYAQAKVAEAFVFQQLKTGYETLLADEKVLSVEQQQSGDVIVTYADKVKKLRWMNADQDRGKPYDLVVKTYSRSDKGDLRLTKKKYIEVKSTRVPGDDLTAYFSANEISLAINPRHSKKNRSIEEGYKLYGVFMTNRKTADHLQEIENPAAAFKGRFKVTLR